MQMPWGKHKGRIVSEVPSSYLAFVVEESSASPDLKEACRQELETRFSCARQHSTHQTVPPWHRDYVPQNDQGVCRDKLKRWYRKASLLAHPDRGGSVGLMKLINELNEL